MLNFEKLNKKEQKIISILNFISQNFNNGEGLKEKNILSLLKDNNASYIKNIGIVVPSLSKTRIVCSSHIDLISKFQKGFKENKKFDLILEKTDIFLTGALDNNITNAILIILINELRKIGLSEDVEFVFTEGEETDMHGMKNYVKQKGLDVFYVNLDVTNDNIKYSSSVEYDKASYEICKQISENLISVGFTKERVNDDLDVVMDLNGIGFSYCLPTKHNIHSYNNSTNVSNLISYMDGLEFILTKLDVSEKSFNIKNLSISEAIKYIKNKFLKKEKKFKSSSFNTILKKEKGKSNYVFEDEYGFFIERVRTFFYLNNDIYTYKNKDINMDSFHLFLERIYKEQRSFSLKEFNNELKLILLNNNLTSKLDNIGKSFLKCDYNDFIFESESGDFYIVF